MGCGLGWIVKKRVWTDYEQLLCPVSLSFYGQKINSKFLEKLHRIKVDTSQKNLGHIFYGGKPSFWGAENLCVNTNVS